MILEHLIKRLFLKVSHALKISKAIILSFFLIEKYYDNIQLSPGKKTVATVIPCYNHLDFTRRAVESYYKTIDDDTNHVLIVVDDRSLDGTEDFFSKNRNKQYCQPCYEHK